MRYTLLLLALITMPLFSQNFTHYTLNGNSFPLTLLTQPPDLTCDTQPYKLVWHDEFNTPIPVGQTFNQAYSGFLNRSRLRILGFSGHWWHLNEANSIFTQLNISIENSCLVQTVKKETTTSFVWGSGDPITRDYTSTHIESWRPQNIELPEGQYDTAHHVYSYFRYGKIEARIKVPKIKGVWFAFWTYGVNGWHNEIDLVEMDLNNTAEYYPSLHVGSGDPYNAHYFGNEEFSYNLSDNFHIYAVQWEWNEIIYKLDGVELFRIPMFIEERSIGGIRTIHPMKCGDGHHPNAVAYYTTHAVPTWKLPLIWFDLTMPQGYRSGAVNESLLPSKTYTDWVRVYQRTPQYPEWTELANPNEPKLVNAVVLDNSTTISLSLSEFSPQTTTIAVEYLYTTECSTYQYKTENIIIPANQSYGRLNITDPNFVTVENITSDNGYNTSITRLVSKVIVDPALIVVCPPPSPMGLTLTGVSQNNFHANWSASNYADGYHLQYRVNSGSWSSTINVSTTNYTSMLRPRLQNCDYVEVKVRAYNTSGESAWSSSQDIIINCF